jgi:hypothetical protein
MSRVRLFALGLVVVLVGAAGTPSVNAVPPPVLVKLNNFRYCPGSAEACTPANQAYVANPTTGEPPAAAYNPNALIDVRVGAIVTFEYRDGPAGATTPTTCDSYNGGPIGMDLGITQLKCPGHYVVLAAAGPGGVQKRVGFLARQHLGARFTWTVPSGLAAGTIIPFFCDAGGGVHYRLGMTGAMRVVH